MWQALKTEPGKVSGQDEIFQWSSSLMMVTRSWLCFASCRNTVWESLGQILWNSKCQNRMISGKDVCHVNLLRPYRVCALSLGSSGSADSPSSATAPPLTACTVTVTHLCGAAAAGGSLLHGQLKDSKKNVWWKVMKVAARSCSSNPVDEWIIVKCENLYKIKKCLHLRLVYHAVHGRTTRKRPNRVCQHFSL